VSDEGHFHPAYFATRFRVPALAPTWPVSFVIVTAHATTGEQWTAAQNAQANASLLERIAALGVWFCPITGFDPGTGHEEPGWAIEVPLSLGLELGRAFHQDAIFAVENDRLSVHSCEHHTWAVIGPFRERVTGE
jgi:hypothetical protein